MLFLLDKKILSEIHQEVSEETNDVLCDVKHVQVLMPGSLLFWGKILMLKRNIVSTLKAFISNAVNFLGIFASPLKRCFRLIPWNHFPFHVHIHFSTFLLFFTSMIRWGLHHIFLNFHYAWWHVLFDTDVSLVPHS